MDIKLKILNDAIIVLRRGEALTIDAVAREAGLTKPGVIHHFKTKEGLTQAVVDRIAEIWEEDLRAIAPETEDPLQRLRAYVEYAMTGTFDPSDLGLMADVRLREQLCQRWAEHLGPWLGMDIDGPLAQRAQCRAARLLADGAWFNSALGITFTNPGEEAALKSFALSLLDTAGEQ